MKTTKRINQAARISWRTTIAGVTEATGLALMGAPLLGWINHDGRHHIMVAGYCVAVAGAILKGIFARDHHVSSEQATT